MKYPRAMSLGFLSVLLISLLLSTVFSTPASAAVASDFHAGNIINDSIFFNNSAMSPAQIQAFLNAKVPTCDTNGTQIYSGTTTRAQYGASRGYPAPYTCLKDYTVSTPDRAGETNLCGNYSGGTKSSAQIIYDVAQACGINPQTLLTLLQKEESLVTDDWPWPSQYQIAAGYGCPDTAACDTTYYGFFNQVYSAARAFRKYARDAGQYNYIAGRNNNILYNPNAACGSSSVFLQNQATAGLYDYTPYQPNQAALDNLYGSGDACSAYGNRNFWRLFYDWFGSTSGGISLIKSDSDPTVFVLYDGEKQGIPSGDVLNAWGLNTLPITTMSSASIAVFPTLPPLTRVAHNPYNNALYLFADSGGTYDAVSNSVSDWGYDPASASTIGAPLVAYTKRLGSLSNFLTAPSAGGLYLMDGGQARGFTNPNTFSSWAGSSAVISISDGLFGSLGKGTAIATNQAQDTANQYLLSNGRLLTLGGGLAAIYPRSNQVTISSALVNTLPVGSGSRFVKGSSPAIYLVDNGTKHGFGSTGLLLSYMANSSDTVTILSDNELSQIPDGNSIATRFAYSLSNSSQQYYINQGGHALTNPNFAAANYGFAISATGFSLLGGAKDPISCTQALVQANNSYAIYVLDSGVRRGIPSLDVLGLIKNSGGNVCVLDPEDVNVIPLGSNIAGFVSNSGTNYLTENNSSFTMPVNVATSLGITSFSPVSATYLSNFASSGTALTSSFITGSGDYVMSDSGSYYDTTNATIARLWGLSPSLPVHNDTLLRVLHSGGGLSQFARPTDPSSGVIYLVDGGKFLPIGSLNGLFNAGITTQNIPRIAASVINANLGSNWQGYLARDPASGAVYVLEGGRKHLVPSSLLSRWLGSTSPITPTNLSADFLSLLAASSDITRSVETGAPGIYGINDGKRAGIPNLQTFNALYAPSTKVTQQLIDSLPYGPPIPTQ